MKRLATVLFVALAACVEVQTPKPPSPGVIAVCDGLEISFDDLESQLPTARTTSCQEAQRAEGRGTTEQLIPCFQELAENTALEHLLLAETPDLDQRITDLLNEQPEIRHIAYIQAWVAEQANELEVTEDEITAFFQAHRGDFLRPRQGQLWNIFRRHKDPAHPEATFDFLSKLKNRCERGESFQSLAREYSHSETRLRDGLVGPLANGNLPPRLQKIAASLGDSEVSDNREAELHQYFDDNRPHYQSEPAFRLEIWDLDFDDDPPSQLLKMERFHTELAEGRISLNTAVERLGGRIETHDWTGFGELDFLPNKGRLYLLQAPTGGYSVPFQQHEALHMIHVIERREPEELEFDQVRDAVREDYLERFSQTLAREVISERLSAGGFTFFTEELRSLLQE